MAYDYSTLTTHDKFVPELWSKELQIARENKLVLAPRVERFDGMFSAGGDKLHIPKLTNLTAGNISPSDGTIDASANTEGEVTLTVDKWKGVLIDVVDIAAAQSKYDLMKVYIEKMAYALGLAVDDDLMALYDGLSTNSVGTNSTDITDAVLRSACQKLDEADVPFDSRFLVVKPSQKNALLGIDKFVRADAIGSGMAIRKGTLGELYGVEVLVSNNVAVSGAETKNLMWHKSAFGLALAQDIKVERFARTAFSTPIGASELYGVAELRDDHACKVKS